MTFYGALRNYLVHGLAASSSEARSSVAIEAPSNLLSVESLETYAFENHLLTEDAEHRRRMTPLGQMLLVLRGRDAIRWLLIAETLQSLGPLDPWHLSRASLSEAMRWEGAEPLHELSVARMVAMGMFSYSLEVGRYVVPEDLRELAASVLENGPWHTTIRAFLEDERLAATPVTVFPRPIADAVVEQTRLFTHEVRNALVPVRHHLDWLAGAASNLTREKIEAARRGVIRLLDFVERWAAVTDTVVEAVQLADLAEVVGDALAQVDGGERVVLAKPHSPVHLRVPRQRLSLAIANLLRNSVQAAVAPARIEISWGAESGMALVHVDDGGPGVAIEDRDRIFDDGFSRRPGGSGFGLAFARRFVESSLRGKVWCESSPLGGARFTISIPLEPLS